MDWRSIASQIISAGAPALGGILMGPLGSTLGGVVGNVLASALGTEPTPEAVSNAIALDPQAPAKLEAADATHGPELQAAADDILKSTMDARASEAALVDKGSSIAWAPAIMSTLNVVGFTAVSLVALFHPVGSDPGVALFLLGVWAGGFGATNNFWLGSSNGSQKKDGVIGNFIERSAGPVGRAIESAVTKQSKR